MHQSLKSHGIRSAARASMVVGALAVGFVLSAAPAHAQHRAKVSIDFAFVAAGTAMEAGSYEIEAARDKVILRSSSGKTASVIMPIVTRLGRHDADKDPELIFDPEIDRKYSRALHKIGIDPTRLVNDAGHA